MKKLAFFVLSTWVFSLFLTGLVGVMPVAAKNNSGKLIKGKSLSTVYFLSESGKRYVFPNSKTYQSWYDNFDGVEEISDDELSKLPLGGNVRYKPGKFLVKIQTDPKVYAVGHNGQLRWIKTERLAKALYGNNWNKLIDDVPDSFFTNYNVGDPIDDEEDYDPEEEEEVDEIDINLGFKTRRIIKKRIETMEQRRCRILEAMVNRVQARFAWWGVELPDNLGSDFIDQCVADDDDDDNDLPPYGKRVTICHQPDGTNPQTITVNRNSLRGHLRHGDHLGECGDTNDDDDEEEEEEEEEEEDTTAPVISNLDVEIGTSTATVTWETDEDADAEIKISINPISSGNDIHEFDDDIMRTEHTFNLSLLEPGTLYYLEVESEDASGNSAEDETTFTTLELGEEQEDTSAPVISNIVVEYSSATATVSYETDEAANAKIVFATESLDTASEPIEISESAYTTEHFFELFDLASSTKYFFRLESADESGNTATTSEDSFTTLE